MSEVNSWSTTAASNNTASPDGFPEGMAPSGVNDSAREIMAAIAKYRSDTDGVTTSGGSANTQTLAASRVMAAYTAGDLYTFKAGFTNTGAMTLNVDTLGAKAVQKHTRALVGGEIVAGGVYTAVYDGTQFQLIAHARQEVIQTAEGTAYSTYANISAVMPADNTIPQITEGAEIVTASITPKSATNRLVIEAECFGMVGSAGTITIALFQDTTVDALAASGVGAGATTVVMPRIRHEMAAGTTSSTTFRMRVGPSSGAANFYINGDTSARLYGGVGATRIRVTEYA